VVYGKTAGRPQGTVYVFREANAWPTTKKAPSPDVFAAAGQRIESFDVGS
jgi:hypothetical protein